MPTTKYALARSLRGMAAGMAVLTLSATGALAEGPAGKVNGDGPNDLAPLGRAGDNNATGPVAHQNTPPIGGATQAGGGNPKESGAVDAERATKKTSGDAATRPDNK